MSRDGLDVHAMGQEDAEQKYCHGQHAQQRTRIGAGPEHTLGRPSRNHAVILAACRQ
ncbi:hypothetical protein Stsp02_20130 [Streptomyces sp. NBRC 14336]|uniref:Uncharacterized protein n=1 Tax=Streptomyces thermocarboxydovorans TaxID=59298 RepID=A0ABN1HEG6_9ACTN|nr:hypothetical protein Stsp02_20130 [Streptomyces sp. NBRC 14336]